MDTNRAREDALVEATWRTVVAESAPMSLAALARRSDVPIRTLSRYVSTKDDWRPIPIDTLVSLVERGLGMSMSQFWGLVEQRAERLVVSIDGGAPITPARDRRP